MSPHRKSTSLTVVAVVLSLSACKDNITVSEPNESNPPNRPPLIRLWGPEYDTTSPIKAPLQLWVLATDPDGVEDIAAVMLRISKVSLVSLIVRPNDPTDQCIHVYYAPFDTINVLPYMNKMNFTVHNEALYRTEVGVYTAYLTYDLLSEGGISAHGDVFGQSVKQCIWSYTYNYSIEFFGLYPPALPAPRDVFVTYAEFSISGISITAYDQSGDSATVKFPDFRGIFTNGMEDQTPP